jgi:hypothetical protein
MHRIQGLVGAAGAAEPLDLGPSPSSELCASDQVPQLKATFVCWTQRTSGATLNRALDAAVGKRI